MFAFLFWISLLGILHTYAIYPLLVHGWAAAVHWIRHAPAAFEESEANPPELTVLITAFNAEQCIAERIANILECDYPVDRLTIAVASDGSTDRTVEIVEQLEQPNVHTLAFPERRGKAAALCEAVELLHSEVIVFTDATTRFDRQALRQLGRHFANPAVGLVSGRIRMIDAAGQPTESFYWKSEMRLRHDEASVGIVLGASGAIYAVRRSLFVAPTRPIINDDLVLPILLQLKHGCKCVVDEMAIAYAASTGGLGSEFTRRCRIGAGAFQTLFVLRELFHWRNAKQACGFVSHKLLRWLCPFLMLVLMGSNLLLLEKDVYRVFLSLQALAYLLAISGLALPEGTVLTRVPRLATSFLMMNVALAVGIVRWVGNPHATTWTPTSRLNWTQMHTTGN